MITKLKDKTVITLKSRYYFGVRRKILPRRQVYYHSTNNHGLTAQYWLKNDYLGWRNFNAGLI